MIVSATSLANDSKAVIDRVISRRESADVHRHGKAVVQIRRKVGVDARELVERLQQAAFTAAETKELKSAMDAANEVFSMPTAIDTSVLIAAEKGGDFFAFIAALPGEFYIPAHAAAEFLVGTHPPVKEHLRERARRIYENVFREMVEPFDEADAAQLAALNAEQRRTGQTMKLYDAAIAAGVIARGDSLLAMDGDFDRLTDRLELLKP